MVRQITLLFLVLSLSAPLWAVSRSERRYKKSPSIQQLRKYFRHNHSLLSQMELAAEAHDLNLQSNQARMIGIVGDVAQDDFNLSRHLFNGL